MKGITLADLGTGEKGVITSFDNESLSLKLMEMGCLPGTPITMTYKAPFNGPVCIDVSGYTLSLRIDEATTVGIKRI